MEKAMVQSCLNESLKCELSDGRFLMGLFQCLDAQGNLILSESIEYRPSDHKTTSSLQSSSSSSSPWTRQLGTVLIPKEHVVELQRYYQDEEENEENEEER